jgi:hypothetical protein
VPRLRAGSDGDVRFGQFLLGVFLTVAHLGEYVVCHTTIAQRPEGPVLAFAMTFFFGVLYWNDFPSEPWDQA